MSHSLFLICWAYIFEFSYFFGDHKVGVVHKLMSRCAKPKLDRNGLVLMLQRGRFALLKV
ncbi:hypothetical protein CXF93_13030 [Moritella sp. Urea-trap-13]|nr:hypothetical protein CXF93_13030 [Moritella sp. Urea-trap-13]